MKKVFVISFILSLILFTAIIKNSTKKIDEDIFALRENIRDKEKEFQNIKLEFEYLSSPEKLKKFQNLYFDDELIQREINEINIIDEKMDKFIIKKGKMNNKNPKIVIEDRQNDFLFKRDKSCLEISFNRIAFVFFIFLLYL